MKQIHLPQINALTSIVITHQFLHRHSLLLWYTLQLTLYSLYTLFVCFCLLYCVVLFNVHVRNVTQLIWIGSLTFWMNEQQRHLAKANGIFTGADKPFFGQGNFNAFFRSFGTNLVFFSFFFQISTVVALLFWNFHGILDVFFTLFWLLEFRKVANFIFIYLFIMAPSSFSLSLSHCKITWNYDFCYQNCLTSGY